MGARLYIEAEDKVLEKLTQSPAGTVARMRNLEWMFQLWNVNESTIKRLESEVSGYKEFREHEISMSKDWHDDGQTLYQFKKAHYPNEDAIYHLCFGKLNSWDYDIIEKLNLSEIGGEVTEPSLIENFLMNHDVDLYDVNINVNDIKNVYWS